MISYWIFQANPEQYKIYERLCFGQPKIMTWRVAQYADKVKEGDRAFMWVCKGKEPDAVLAGLLEVLCDPIIMDRLSFDQPFLQDQNLNGRTNRVICRIVMTTRITKDDLLRRRPELSNLPNLRMTQGTNYPLDEQQASSLRELMGIW